MIPPSVSIIIVNYNGQHLLEDCLKSLSNLRYKNYEIIVVDNNSSDNSVEYIKTNYPSIVILKLEKNYGFALPNNTGAKIAKGEFILFLNNDTKVEPNLLNELISVFQNDPEIGIAQSLLLDENGNVDSSGDFIDKNGIAFSSHEKLDSGKEIFSAKGAAMIIKKKLFFKLDGFDEKFFATFEDVDLGWRCWILGYKVVIVPSSIVYHMRGKTIQTLKNVISFHGYKNQLVMRLTNFEVSRAVTSVIRLSLTYGIKLLNVWFDYKIYGKTSITLNRYEEKLVEKPNWKIIIKSIFWVLMNTRYINSKRRFVAKNRIHSTRFLEERKVII